MFLRGAIIAFGLVLFVVGLAAFFRPEVVAEAVMLSPETAVGLGNIRVLVGGHYLAIGLTAILAAVITRPGWLVPLAAIEGFMLLARVVAAISGEMDRSGLVGGALEIIICAVFCYGAIALGRSSRKAPTT